MPETGLAPADRAKSTSRHRAVPPESSPIAALLISGAREVLSSRGAARGAGNADSRRVRSAPPPAGGRRRGSPRSRARGDNDGPPVLIRLARDPGLDRKSTRLNSSHSQISYAVFCLQKKKT